MKDIIYSNMQRHNKELFAGASLDTDAKYLKSINSDIRTPYFRDIDKIIYSLAYARYMDKTQVFTKKQNDHIQKRMLHVQYVSKIARTIGRALNLNEDLIEAAALGHDLGHTPYGHVGEAILNKISVELNEGFFMHNLNSVRLLMNIENGGNGLNISLQVLDAIMCHNGELVSNEYYPKNKNIDSFLNEYFSSYKSLDVAKYLRPMTLEGCVVRISDIIAYLGKDIEDAQRLGIVDFSDIPVEITNILGNSNSEIVNTIVMDIIKNSQGKNYLKLSDEVFEAVCALKDFNYENIYLKAYDSDERKNIELMFRSLVIKYLNDLESDNRESDIFKLFINDMNESYLENSNARIVIDFISGMTDNFFKAQYDSIKE